jgi:hypothetical protein
MPTICVKCKYVARDLLPTTYYCTHGSQHCLNTITGLWDTEMLPTCAKRRGSDAPTADCPDYEAAPAKGE